MSGVCQRVILTMVAAALPVGVFAQQEQKLRDRDPDLEASKRLAAELQQANFRSGPFYLLSRLRIAEAGFSDVFYVPTGSQSGGVSLTVEAPQRLYIVPHKKAIVTAQVVPGYTFLREGRRTGQFNYAARGDLHLLFNHIYLDAYAQRADEIRAHISDINRLATTREDEIGVGGELKYSSRTSALFTVRRRDTEYPLDRYQPELDPLREDDPITLLERSENNGRLSFHHKTFPRTSLFVSGERSNYDFENASYKNSRRTWYGAGFIYDTGRGDVRLEAGPLRLDFNDPAEPDYSGIGGSLRAARAGSRWEVTGGLERDIGFSIFLNNNYFVSSTAAAGISYLATRRLTLRSNAAFQRDEYETPVFGNLRRDTMSFTSVGFSYLIRRLRTGVDVGYYRRESTFGGDEDSGIRYAVHLSLNQ